MVNKLVCARMVTNVSSNCSVCQINRIGTREGMGNMVWITFLPAYSAAFVDNIEATKVISSKPKHSIRYEFYYQ